MLMVGDISVKEEKGGGFILFFYLVYLSVFLELLLKLLVELRYTLQNKNKYMRERLMD